MNNDVFFTFEDDILVKHIHYPQFEENIYKTEVVIDKETFLKCVKRWMTESEGKK